MISSKVPKFKVLLLVGAGHANVQVLKHLTMHDYEGVQTILINQGYTALYSGMTPGLIEDYYQYEDASIDLPKLCTNSNTIFINDEVIKLDEKNQCVYLKRHPPIKFSILSLNVGSISKMNKLDISKKSNVINVKPISNLYKQIDLIKKLIKEHNSISCSIIGGGIAGIEIAFALKQRFKNKINLSIFSKTTKLEKNINNITHKKLINHLKTKNIKYIHSEILSVQDKFVEDNKKKYPSNLNIISTGVMSLNWVINSKLSLDKEGFIKVNSNLQSENYENIFATGDIASLNYAKRPKSGVMAVRQGEKLKKNIFNLFLGKKLFKFIPQNSWLYLIGIGNRNAVMNWHKISIEGRFIWNFKEFIDRGFMKKFHFDKPMKSIKKIIKLPLPRKVKDQVNLPMRCEGCGSKLSKNYLVKYLSSNNSLNSEILSDGTTINLSNNELIQSIDHIKYYNNMDPYVFGRISYLHSQNDILSSGGKVNSFSVSLGLPYNEDITQSFYLDFFMKGLQDESTEDNSIFASGHTYTSDEPGITLNMNGTKDIAISKNYAEENELIYLTKPLGVGFLMSAFINNSVKVSPKVYETIIKNMLLSNKKAYEICISNRGKPLTDVSGFGLASHLIDICNSSNLTANLNLRKEIIIAKCNDELNTFKSSAYDDNKDSSIDQIKILNKNNLDITNLSRILFDPQTSGPLIISLSEKNRTAFEDEFAKSYGFMPLLIGDFKKREEKALNIY